MWGSEGRAVRSRGDCRLGEERASTGERKVVSDCGLGEECASVGECVVVHEPEVAASRTSVES